MTEKFISHGFKGPGCEIDCLAQYQVNLLNCPHADKADVYPNTCAYIILQCSEDKSYGQVQLQPSAFQKWSHFLSMVHRCPWLHNKLPQDLEAQKGGGGGTYDFMIPGARNLGWVSWAYFCGLTEPTQEVKRPRGSFSRDHSQVDHPEQPCLRRYHTRAQNPKRDMDG